VVSEIWKAVPQFKRRRLHVVWGYDDVRQICHKRINLLKTSARVLPAYNRHLEKHVVAQ
jgi:hypothetical protein